MINRRKFFAGLAATLAVIGVPAGIIAKYVPAPPGDPFKFNDDIQSVIARLMPSMGRDEKVMDEIIKETLDRVRAGDMTYTGHKDQYRHFIPGA